MLCACSFFCFSASSQGVLGFAPGELNFANRSIVSNIDAPVSDVTGKHVGAGSGTAVQVLTKGKQVQVPSETKLDFELEQPVEISIMPGQNKRAHSQE